MIVFVERCSLADALLLLAQPEFFYGLLPELFIETCVWYRPHYGLDEDLAPACLRSCPGNLADVKVLAIEVFQSQQICIICIPLCLTVAHCQVAIWVHALTLIAENLGGPESVRV